MPNRYRMHTHVQSEMRSLLVMIPLYSRNNATGEAANTLQQAIHLLESLPDSRARVYATIDLARLLQPVAKVTSRTECLTPEVLPLAESLLNQAVTIAQRLQDFRAESFALGELAHTYECRQKYPQALEITNRARLAAQQDLKAQDSLCSTLGLAGVAVQAGARSVLASLWAINDASTVQIVSDFYTKLFDGSKQVQRDRNVTKAQALQAAQTALIEGKQYTHPYYWSGFILIGNWL